jgi:hypothetical protein
VRHGGHLGRVPVADRLVERFGAGEHVAHVDHGCRVPVSVRLILDLKKSDMIGLRVCGRSRRPSEGSRRSRVWTCPTPTSALKAPVLARSLHLNRILQHLGLSRDTINEDMENLDRDHFDKLVLKVASRVASDAFCST